MGNCGGRFENTEKSKEGQIIAYLSIDKSHVHTVVFFSFLITWTHKCVVVICGDRYLYIHNTCNFCT